MTIQFIKNTVLSGHEYLSGEICAFGPADEIAQVAAMNAVVYPPVGSTLSINNRATRVALIGDSLVSLGLNVNIPVTSFVVTGGIATLTTSGNNYIGAGNYFHLSNSSDTLMAHADNGTNPLALTGTGGSSFTFKSNAPDGTYTVYAGGTWYIYALSGTSDSSWFAWLNNFMQSQFLVTQSFSMVGYSAAFWSTPNAISRIMATAANFDVAVVDMGINDIALSTDIATAMTNASVALANVKLVVKALRAAGKTVMLAVPNPLSAVGYTLAQRNYRNYGIMQLREGLLSFASRDSNIIPVDAFSGMIDGTVAGGDIIANGTFDGIHPSSQACVPFARALAPYIPGIAVRNARSCLQQDDIYGAGYTANAAATPYANRFRNSALIGTAGNLVPGTGTCTGTVAGNGTTNDYRVTNTVGSPGTVCTAQTVPTLPTGVYAGNWPKQGYAQRLQITFNATGDTVTFGQHDFNDTTNWTAGWYQARITVYIRALGTNVGNISLTWGSPNNNAFANVKGNNNNPGATGGLPLVAGDFLTLATGPVYLAAAPTNNILTLSFVGQAASATALDVEVLAPEVRQIDNPYAIL